MKLPNSIIELSKIFKDNGKKLYVVGGYVRDTVMGLKPLDIDLCTDSLPNETLEFIRERYKANLVGKSFGVIILTVDGEEVEIASFREDGSGRKPTVKLGVTIEDDVQRRDITISAMYYDIDENKLVDLVGGRKDIHNRIIRMVGNPYDRIKEDPLRILRVIRYASRYDYDIESETYKAVMNSSIDGISKERVIAEMNKAYKNSISFVHYLRLISEFNLWKQIFKGFEVNSEDIVEQPCLELYLANLLRYNDPIKLIKLKTAFKFSSSITETIVFLIKLQDFKPKNILEIYKEMKRIRIDKSLIKNWLKILKTEFSKKCCITLLNYEPTVTSKELIDEGFTGRELGLEMKKREASKFIVLVQ